ncbi:probable signal peptide protein [Ralstonia pseudosolanacearum GMI1000]|uniref:Probable signal peptide protein n=1 Tax=Ralstonia nicotianae (strain ATCC BAA-1114 / GMI1000) TaxID=267608 RepID=Q8Y0S3_RALN1|nr:probable signal peptide protein [Ralstonia pseudosolanacearum GMI1000]
MWVAFGCGVAIAGISATTQGATCGTGYDQAAALLNGHPIATHGFNITKLAAAGRPTSRTFPAASSRRRWRSARGSANTCGSSPPTRPTNACRCWCR